MEQVQNIYRQSASPKVFFTELEKSKIDTYERNGKIAGVRSKNGRKFRLKTIGFDSTTIALLSKTYQNLQRLQVQREKQKQQKNNEYEK